MSSRLTNGSTIGIKNLFREVDIETIFFPKYHRNEFDFRLTCRF